MPEEPILTDAKGYSILRLGLGDERFDFFTRRYGGKGGELAYFQWMTSGLHPYESQRDVQNVIDNPLGRVELPAGKKSRNELVPGDVLKVYNWGGEGAEKASEFEYVETV